MFFILSKTLSHLLMPTTIIMGAFIASYFIKNPHWKRRLVNFGLVLLVLCTNPALTNTVLKLWEIPPTPMAEVTADRTVGIVLTGVTHKTKLPHDRVYFSQGADRVTHALQLYKTGKIEKIIISGGTGKLFKPGIKEAGQLREVLLMCNVPEEDLIIENESRNTRESALAVAEIIKGQFPDHHYLLITSGFHMRRARACFDKAGIPVRSFTTDFKTSDEPLRFTSFVIPEPTSLYKWHILVRELMGLAAYRVMGYL